MLLQQRKIHDPAIQTTATQKNVGQNHLNNHGLFATVINCMDGRVQLPVISWVQQTYHVQYVDMVTEPGPVKILAEKQPEYLLESVKNRVHISVRTHGSNLICIVGHYDCAGNPVCKDKQLQQLRIAKEVVESWSLQTRVILLWVDEQWIVHEIT